MSWKLRVPGIVQRNTDSGRVEMGRLHTAHRFQLIGWSYRTILTEARRWWSSMKEYPCSPRHRRERGDGLHQHAAKLSTLLYGGQALHLARREVDQRVTKVALAVLDLCVAIGVPADVVVVVLLRDLGRDGGREQVDARESRTVRQIVQLGGVLRARARPQSNQTQHAIPHGPTLPQRAQTSRSQCEAPAVHQPRRVFRTLTAKRTAHPGRRNTPCRTRAPQAGRLWTAPSHRRTAG
jgi:hypothetical protein